MSPGCLVHCLPPGLYCGCKNYSAFLNAKHVYIDGHWAVVPEHEVFTQKWVIQRGGIIRRGN